MKLLFVLEDLLVGGAQVHSVDLAERLRARGFEVEALVLGAQVNPILAQRFGPGLSILAQSGLGRPREWGRLAGAIRARGAAVIFSVGPVATCVAAAALGTPGRRTRPSLVAIHHATRVGSAAGWARTAPFMLAARACQALVFVSERQASYWRRRGLGAGRVQVIRNGVDLQHYTAAACGRSAAKAALGLNGARLTLGAVAMFRPEKNHGDMVKALSALRTAGVNAELLLVGDGPTRPAIQALAERQGLEDHVRFCGLQADVRPFLATMDVGVLASTRIETLPLFGLELMASGAPLVAPRIGGLEELVQDGDDGLLYPPGDTAALVRQLKRCADPVVRARLGVAAALKAKRFCVEGMADAYARLATELAEARAA